MQGTITKSFDAVRNLDRPAGSTGSLWSDEKTGAVG
jgi:hypothetical protein